MDHLALGIHLQGKIEARVELTLVAFTSGLATAARHRDEAADEEGFLVKELGQTGAGQAFLGGQVVAVLHGVGPPFILIYVHISE
jgi:hypothetical protein